MKKLNTLSGDAAEAYQATLNPETHNRPTITRKKVAFATLKAFLNKFVPALVANRLISESDLELMGLSPIRRHYRQPPPPPAVAPEVSTTVGQGHEVIVYASKSQHGHPSETLPKKDHFGFVVRYCKEGETEWHEIYTTHYRLTLRFNDSDEGKQLTLAAAWINRRIQYGPWSDEIHVLIN
jgi:hypothetical protein